MTSPVAVVTGGAGFLGSHMVDLLRAEGYRVRVIDDLSGGRLANLAHLDGDPDVCVEIADIRTLDPGDAMFAAARHVFHFAGIGDIVPSIERPSAYTDVNVQGTVRVLECARHAGVERLVYAASSSCYGLAAVPTPETAPIAPEYPYALSKWMGEAAAFHWHRVYGLPVASIRIFNAYGVRSRTTGAYGAVFGVFLAQKLAGQPFTVVGDGSQRRDFVHARDVAHAFLAAARSGRAGEAYNIGAGEPQTVNRIVELLGGPVVPVPKRPGEPEVTWADTTKARTELGWQARVRFEDGVGEMVADIERWRDAPVWDPASIEAATSGWFTALARGTA